MKYYVFKNSASKPYSELYTVGAPKKNSIGKYTVGKKFKDTVSKTMIAPLDLSQSSSNLKKEAEGKTISCYAGGTVLRTVNQYSTKQTFLLSTTGYKSIFDITNNVKNKSSSVLKSTQVSSDEIKKEIYAMKNWAEKHYTNIDRGDINYIQIGDGKSNSKSKAKDLNLYLFTHTKGKYTIIRRDVLIQKFNGKVIKSVVIEDTIKFDSKGNPTGLSAINKKYNDYVRLGANYYRYDIYFDVILNFTKSKLAKAGDYEIGSWEGSHCNVIGASDSLKEYCFYCKNCDKEVKGKRLSYLGSGIPIEQSSHASYVHDQSTHGIRYTGESKGSNDGSTVSYSAALTYGIKGDATKAKGGEAVKKLAYGSVGEYKDGVAPTPIVMIELRGKDDDKFPPYNISLPANSFVSLTHERNMKDSYNTFNLQVFDKDAMQVEAYLLLGYRFIQFYYTDFVATSKRFKGEILNYQTVLTGKGLMLTIDGYTSNADIYTGKESLPWSYFFNVGDYSFLYWLNNAGEDHGLVRVGSSKEGFTLSEFLSGGYKDSTTIYNNEEGFTLPGRLLKDQYPKIYEYLTGKGAGTVGPIPQNKLYELKNADGDYITYDTYAEDVAEDIKEKYRPRIHEFSLESYNANIANELASRSNIFQDMRPSNVVVLICVLNKWKYDPKDIVTTEKVSAIPDQISKSWVQYIKEDLIPISMSTGGASNYNFWFDDNGYVHFAPGSTESSGKTLYFNSIGKKDSYPLISFTAATNGAVLMQTDATQLMESINIFTGDEMNFQAIKSDKLTTSIHKSEEWYATNTIINKDSDAKLVTYPNLTGIDSKDKLKSELANRYGTVAKYSYQAELSVYGCADLEPGTSVDVYIYINDGKRSDDPVSTDTWVKDNERVAIGDENKRYKGNITMHHTSGRYFIYKITDSISAGRYVSTLKVLKVDDGQLKLIVGDGEEITEYDMLDGSNESENETGTVLPTVEGTTDVGVPVKGC